MSEVERLVMQYAQNRKDMTKAQNSIKALCSEDENGWNNIDLNGYREAWLEQGYHWYSWSAAIKHEEDINDEAATSDEKALAVLLDKKALLRRECGNIKRRLCVVGKRLLLSNPVLEV